MDAETRWAFQTRSSVTVHSSIVRLGDLIRPLDDRLAGWQRLKRSPVGLVPVDGSVMVIERQRLEKAIRQAEATPNWIDWIGPERIEVVYRPEPNRSSEHSTATKIQQPTQHASHRVASAVAANTTPALPAVNTLPRTVTRAIVSQIERAISYQFAEVQDVYQLHIDSTQADLMPLDGIVGTPRIRWLDPVADGECRIRVDGKSYDEPLNTTILVKLTPHPQVVFATTTLQRGHRIRHGDLTLMPMPADQLEADYVSDAAELIGMEVRRTLRAERPVSRGDVGRPILIQRGDLVEIRVHGGGVMVSTNGKALETGAESDTIEVETLSPRKRMLARVVQSGLVEIITRAPRVSR